MDKLTITVEEYKRLTLKDILYDQAIHSLVHSESVARELILRDYEKHIKE